MRFAVSTMLGVAAACLLGLAPASAWADSETEDQGSDSVRRLVDWVRASGDNGDVPYVVVDKVAARVFVHDPDGALIGASDALLGFATGDDSTPGIGDRELEAIKPEEKTTPAGRFVASYGPAEGQGDVFWVDYATAISLHPVPVGKPEERRLERLKSPSPEDNRITYGCINVPADFYKRVVEATLRGRKSVVYVLPETRSFAEVFPGAMTYAAGPAATGSATPVAATSEEDVWKRLQFEPRVVR